MSAHITLRSEPGSAHFPERSIELQEGASVRVSRLSRDERPNYNNVIFNSRVRFYNSRYLRYFLIKIAYSDSILKTGCFEPFDANFKHDLPDSPNSWLTLLLKV